MEKAKHAHGSRKNLEAAIASKAVNAFDVLFLSGDDEAPAFGWLDKNGNPIIITPTDDLAKVEDSLKTELATKVNAEEVKAEVEAAVEKTTEKTKYEVVNVPAGTLVDYRDKEIRIMCPENTVFEKQSVGVGGDANTYYFTFKTFAPSDDAVGYIEHLGGQVDEQILTSFNVDENGRRYQPTWLGLAKYDESTGVWNYYGKSSEPSHYIGWDYQIDWYNADNVMIASDSVRINLSNENCHSIIEPYYVGTMKKNIETLVDEKIKEVESAYEVIEF